MSNKHPPTLSQRIRDVAAVLSAIADEVAGVDAPSARQDRAREIERSVQRLENLAGSARTVRHPDDEGQPVIGPAIRCGSDD